MPRLRNVNTGAVVSVSDELAKVLGSEWAAADSEPKPAAAKRTTASK